MSNPPCKAHNKDGRPCKQFAQNGSDYCRAHDPNKPPRRSGAPKGNKNALRHGGYARRTQAPADWPDPDIRQLAKDLDHCNTQLLEYLRALQAQAAAQQSDSDQSAVRSLSPHAASGDPLSEMLSPDQVAKVVAIFGQNASRIGRLLRDQRAISGEAADGIAGAIAQILEEVGHDYGRQL